MKLVHSKYSKFTADDLADMDYRIANAIAVYQQYVDEYNWGVAFGSTKYAEKTRLPRVNAAKAIVDTLQAQKKAMLSDIGQIQGIDIVNTSVDSATADTQTEIPWKTIGLAVGALIVIVIIVKLI